MPPAAILPFIRRYINKAEPLSTDTVIFWYVTYKFTFHPAHTPLNLPAGSQELHKVGI